MADKTGDGGLVPLIPGDRELNEIKAGNLVPGVEALDEADFLTLAFRRARSGRWASRGNTRRSRPELDGDVSSGLGANRTTSTTSARRREGISTSTKGRLMLGRRGPSTLRWQLVSRGASNSATSSS